MADFTVIAPRNPKRSVQKNAPVHVSRFIIAS
jgi:hypothetical protein